MAWNTLAGEALNITLIQVLQKKRNRYGTIKFDKKQMESKGF